MAPKTTSEPRAPKPLFSAGYWWLLLGGAGATWWMAQNPAWTEEHFSRSWYPRVREWQQSLVGRFSFSVAEGLAALVIAGVLVDLLARLLVGPGGLFRRLAGALLVPVKVAIGLYVLYLALWGGHQYRLSLDERLGWEMQEGSTESVVQLAERVVNQLREDRPRVEDPAGFRVWEPDGAGQRLAEGLKTLQARFPEFEGRTPALRGFGNSDLWAQFGIAGLYVPFTGEPHIHWEGPPSRWPFSALHECIHQRGYAREDEANFLAWWAAQLHGDPYLRYSANLVAWAYLKRSVMLADPEAYVRLQTSLPKAVREDIAARRRFWKRHESPLRQVGQKTNDLFLKSQGQTGGILRYGEMVRWMLQVSSTAGSLGEEPSVPE